MEISIPQQRIRDHIMQTAALREQVIITHISGHIYRKDTDFSYAELMKIFTIIEDRRTNLSELRCSSCNKSLHVTELVPGLVVLHKKSPNGGQRADS